ncbi:MAG: carboxypeptidase-like regulatory domain-containing protein [Anaerolineae bacterium]
MFRQFDVLISMRRRPLLCLLCVSLSIGVVTVLWSIVPSFKLVLAHLDYSAAGTLTEGRYLLDNRSPSQLGDEGAGYAEAQLGPGKRVQLPAIDNENGWETWIQVQNVGTAETGVVVFFWGDYSGECPANNPGPIGTACMRVLENAVWTLEARIPTQAKSAIAYAVATTVFAEACEDAGDAVVNTTAWRAWEDIYGGTGEPLAVIAQRKGPNDFGTVVYSAYPGLTESMQGEGPPYQYFTPYAMRRYHNLYTVMVIQNGGDQCTPVSIYYKEQAPCFFEWIQRVEQLAPGESVRLRVPDKITCEWLGSTYVKANQPLSIIVDQTSFSKYCPDSDDRGTLLTYWAQPYRPAGDTLLYAGLQFRAWSGWQTGIQVQNLTQESLPTFVTVDFMDNSGGELLFLGDWICPNGATTFFLPAITDLGFDYAGSADIQSHKQVDYPSGKETGGQPIFAVVDVKKAWVYSDTFDRWEPALPGEAQGGAYNADPLKAGPGWGYIALPSISKSDEVISAIAIRNNSNCNRIQLQINIHDSTGARQTIISSLWLGPKQLRLIDLANIGTVVSGFIGAGVVEVTSVEQLCDTDGDGHLDPEPIMPSVTVLNKGHPAGDITTVYDGIPFKEWDIACSADLLGKVLDDNTREPLKDVTVTVPQGWHITATEAYTDAIGVTGPAGMYEVKDIVTKGTLEPGTCYTVTASVDGYLGSIVPDVCLHCGEDRVLDFSLICNTNIITGTVTQYVTLEDGSPPVAGATVTAKWTAYPGTDDLGEAITTTNALGHYELQDLPKEVEINVTISKEGYDVITDTHEFTSLTCNQEWGFSVVLNCWAEVRGVVWSDIDDDGDLDLGEPFVPSQKVDLYTDNQTKLLNSTTTNEQGQYKFDVGKDLFDPGDFDWGHDLDVGVGTTMMDTAPIWPCTVNVRNFGL